MMEIDAKKLPSGGTGAVNINRPALESVHALPPADEEDLEETQVSQADPNFASDPNGQVANMGNSDRPDAFAQNYAAFKSLKLQPPGLTHDDPRCPLFGHGVKAGCKREPGIPIPCMATRESYLAYVGSPEFLAQAMQPHAADNDLTQADRDAYMHETRLSEMLNLQSEAGLDFIYQLKHKRDVYNMTCITWLLAQSFCSEGSSGSTNLWCSPSGGCTSV